MHCGAPDLDGDDRVERGDSRLKGLEFQVLIREDTETSYEGIDCQ